MASFPLAEFEQRLLRLEQAIERLLTSQHTSLVSVQGARVTHCGPFTFVDNLFQHFEKHPK